MSKRLSEQLEQAASSLEIINMFSTSEGQITVCMDGIRHGLIFPQHKNNDLIRYLAATITSEIRRLSFLIGRGDQGNEGDQGNG